MKTVVLATLSFAAVMAGSAFVIPVVILLSQNPRRPDVAGDLLVAAYLIAVSSSLCTLAS